MILTQGGYDGQYLLRKAKQEYTFSGEEYKRDICYQIFENQYQARFSQSECHLPELQLPPQALIRIVALKHFRFPLR